MTPALELRRCVTGSWLDPYCAPSLSRALSERLWARCRGHRGLFVTLTYRREEWQDARDLYRSTSEQQHVPLFIRKVERHLGESFKGRWFCKLEFQRGGWVHWHIIILDVVRIPHEDLTRMWGHGHVWVNRLSPRRIRYCTKYVCKDGDMPAWLYFERPKSIKVVRVSPGFWGPGDGAGSASSPDPGPQEDESRSSSTQIPDLYVSIGDRIDAVRARVVARDSEGRYDAGQCDLGRLLLALLRRGCRFVGATRGWLGVVMCAPGSALATFQSAVGEAAGGVGRGAAGPAVHLSRNRNPDDAIPPRLEAWFRESAS